MQQQTPLPSIPTQASLPTQLSPPSASQSHPQPLDVSPYTTDQIFQPKIRMYRTTCFSVLVRITALIFIIGVLAVAIVSIQDTPAAAIGGITGRNSQGIANTTIGAGPNITGSLSLRDMLAKKAGSEVHLSLANASTITEKTVGPNSHAVSVRIGVVRGFVVYIALVSDINHGIHIVLVDAGNGKVLGSTQVSTATMMMRHGLQ